MNFLAKLAITALVLPNYVLAADVEECGRKSDTPGWQIIRDPSHSNEWNVLKTKYPLVTSKLVTASLYGNDALIRSLMSKKQTKADMANALYVASSMGRLSTVTTLIKAGVSPNIETREKFTALYAASQYGCPQTIARLVKLGADVNFHTDARYSVLMSSISSQQYIAAKTLLNYGYRASIKEKAGIKKFAHHEGRDSIYEDLFGNDESSGTRPNGEKEKGAE